jgi:predicted RecB family nuclease
MQLLGGSLVLSPTDLVGFSLCPHLSGLELTAATGERVRPRRADPELDLLRRRGLEHERRFLDALRAQGRTVAEVPRLDVADGGLPRSAELTLEAMRSGAGVVYQATFFDGRWLGTADFLLRVDGQSALGPFAYEPADAKLAHEARPGVLLQLCAYAEQLARVQGALPEQVHVVLGDGKVAAFPFRAFAAYFRSKRRWPKDWAGPTRSRSPIATHVRGPASATRGGAATTIFPSSPTCAATTRPGWRRPA